MDNSERIKYANQWEMSANHFLNNQDYSWMADCISGYNCVLEVGAGTGHSTLVLAQKGHKIVTIEKNEHCILKAKELLRCNGVSYCDLNSLDANATVVFINSDICDIYLDQLCNLNIDVVACWNIGTHWSKEMMKYYIGKMLNYGLTVDQIKENMESSYGEFIQWSTVESARNLGVPVHIVDRNLYLINEENDVYFSALKDQFNYESIQYLSRESSSISNGGRPLTAGDGVLEDDEVQVVLVSILMF